MASRVWTGPDFRRVELKDRRRGGVLGMAAVLTLTSYPRRTSPVLRGKWVLEELLGTPPPPPPAMVKSLPTDDRIRNGLTFRQRLEQHRKKAECACVPRPARPAGLRAGELRRPGPMARRGPEEAG